ncbi:hypothetical protein [Mesorhizobium australicum]|uniref:Uncharacterized protein n=1 Tax=Mesorhizobium australicum TaxID=536018 RepID=A0ACC6SU83_9HYPH
MNLANSFALCALCCAGVTASLADTSKQKYGRMAENAALGINHSRPTIMMPRTSEYTVRKSEGEINMGLIDKSQRIAPSPDFAVARDAVWRGLEVVRQAATGHKDTPKEPKGSMRTSSEKGAAERSSERK